MKKKQLRGHSHGSYQEMNKALNAALERLGVPQQTFREGVQVAGKAGVARRAKQKT